MGTSLTKLPRELLMRLVEAVEKDVCGDRADDLHGFADAHLVHQEEWLALDVTLGDPW